MSPCRFYKYTNPSGKTPCFHSSFASNSDGTLRYYVRVITERDGLHVRIFQFRLIKLSLYREGIQRCLSNSGSELIFFGKFGYVNVFRVYQYPMRTYLIYGYVTFRRGLLVFVCRMSCWLMRKRARRGDSLRDADSQIIELNVILTPLT